MLSVWVGNLEYLTRGCRESTGGIRLEDVVES